jgi:hypothetical protein
VRTRCRLARTFEFAHYCRRSKKPSRRYPYSVEMRGSLAPVPPTADASGRAWTIAWHRTGCGSHHQIVFRGEHGVFVERAGIAVLGIWFVSFKVRELALRVEIALHFATIFPRRCTRDPHSGNQGNTMRALHTPESLRRHPTSPPTSQPTLPQSLRDDPLIPMPAQLQDLQPPQKALLDHERVELNRTQALPVLDRATAHHPRRHGAEAARPIKTSSGRSSSQSPIFGSSPFSSKYTICATSVEC